MRIITISCTALLLASSCNTQQNGTSQTAAVKQGSATTPDAKAKGEHGACKCKHHADCKDRADCDCKEHGHGLHGHAHGEHACKGEGLGPHGHAHGDCKCKHHGREHGDCKCKGHGREHGDCKCKGHGRCMLGKLVHAALDLPDLRPAQREALLALKREVHAKKKEGPAGAAHAALARELAKQIRAGAIDRARLQLLADKLDAAKGAQKLAAKTAALNKLHALLDAAQRQKLVAALEREGKDQHGPSHHAREKEHHVGHLLHKLGLSDEQRTQIVSKLNKRLDAQPDDKALRAKISAARTVVTTAFKGEKFDATKLSLLKELHARRPGRPQKLVELVATALPLLSVEQKTKLAELFERKAKRLAE